MLLIVAYYFGVTVTLSSNADLLKSCAELISYSLLYDWKVICFLIGLGYFDKSLCLLGACLFRLILSLNPDQSSFWKLIILTVLQYHPPESLKYA